MRGPSFKILVYGLYGTRPQKVPSAERLLPSLPAYNRWTRAVDEGRNAQPQRPCAAKHSTRPGVGCHVRLTWYVRVNSLQSSVE